MAVPVAGEGGGAVLALNWSEAIDALAVRAARAAIRGAFEAMLEAPLAVAAAQQGRLARVADFAEGVAAVHEGRAAR